MKFNKHNSYRSKKEKIKCPKCNSSAYIVRYVGYLMCGYCEIKFNEKESK
jgi:uncharacterized CHY-type Zn-finger protein